MIISKHCPECDGQNIYQQTYWTWSVVSQDWESADDDLIHCPDCEWKGYSVVSKEHEEKEVETG